MSIDHWLDDPGRQAIERMGAPTMTDWWHIDQRMTAYEDRCFCWEPEGEEVYSVIALALLRDWAITFIAKQYDWYNMVGMGRLWSCVGHVKDDYDAALIAAVLAVEAP